MSEVIASPSTRRLARQRGVDIAALAQRLGRNTIGPEDITGGTAIPSAQHPAPMPLSDASAFWDVDHSQYGPVTEEPLTRFDRLAARNLAAAQALIPAVTHHDRVEVTAIESFRARLKTEAAARGVRLTALAFHVMALSRCLRDFPRVNASLSPDGERLILKTYVHIGIAVDTPHGLMVPVIRNADQKGLWQIATEITHYAQAARDRKLRPEDMGGASMSITNLGGIGGTTFTPIINPPELAILGLTKTETTTKWHGNTPKPVPITPLNLTYDHRAINGATAANLTNKLKSYIQIPNQLIF